MTNRDSSKKQPIRYILALMLMLGLTGKLAAECFTGQDAQNGVYATSTYNGSYNSQAAYDLSLIDNAEGGSCALGVANILLAQGFPVTRGHAYTWDESLPANGWTKTNYSPANAPEGAVCVYNNSAGGTSGGAKYGHVEIVSNVNGKRQYISDKARNNWGGTVPQNFAGCFTYNK